MKKIVDIELKQINFLDERFYLRDAQKELYYPSVTEILSVYPKGFGFHQWLKDVGNNAGEIAQRAADRGSLVHNALDKIAKGESIIWDEKVYDLETWQGILKGIEFLSKCKIILTEQNVFNDDLQYAGTTDLVCKIDNDIWLIDYKFSQSIYKTNYLQVAAYKEAFNKCFDEKITKCGILHLKAQTRGEDKKGKTIQGEGWKLIEVEDIDKYYKLFEMTNAIYREENPIIKPKNLIYPMELKL